MKPCDKIFCKDFPCEDINIGAYSIPEIELKTDDIKVVMISEATSTNISDNFYSGQDAADFVSVQSLFQRADVNINSIQDILDSDIYITTAVKCAKTSYLIKTNTIGNCSEILEAELGMFPNLKAIILNGDVAIKAFNKVTKRQVGKGTIPNKSTYRIRHNQYYFNDIRVFPSYIITGKNILIEKSKASMVIEDIKTALEYINKTS